MRDPQATVALERQRVVRDLHAPLEADHFLRSKVAQEWVDEGRLIPFDWENELRLVSPRIPFVTSPQEWCDAQFKDAAALTLDLLESSNQAGVDLKDASAWNVVFHGSQPIFCDLTSFETLQARAWWAAGQFSRHFISPLWLSRETGLRAKDCFLLSRDGTPPEVVRDTLRWKRFISRRWPTVAASTNPHSTMEPKGHVQSETLAYRKRLVTSLRWMISDLGTPAPRETTWSRYTEQREHYSADDLHEKQRQVSAWLGQLQPGWTLDLGCNNGEFSTLAAEMGSKVIAVDGDHDSIQSLYKSRIVQQDIYPVIASLDDLPAGRGWAGTEHSGLATRLVRSADMVLMLALIHHLCIAAAIPALEVARLAAQCTRRWLIVELLEPTDAQVRLLCAARRRDPYDFSMDAQRAAFSTAGFALIKETSLPSRSRSLALMELST